jgi:hypothetical protein
LEIFPDRFPVIIARVILFDRRPGAAVPACRWNYCEEVDCDCARRQTFR